MRFQREKAGVDFFKEALPLFFDHANEVSYFAGQKLNIDFENYLRLEDADMLRVYTARNDSNALCGYAVFILSRHMHYKDELMASQTAIFIPKDERGFGLKLIKWCNEELAKEKVSIVIHRVTKQLNYSPLLLRDGFDFMEVAYVKELKHEVA